MHTFKRTIAAVAACGAMAGAGTVAADDVSLAERAFRDGFYDVAARQFDQSLREQPAHTRSNELRLLLGRSYFELQQWSNSLCQFQSLGAGATPGPTYSEAQFWSGRIFEQMQDTPKALFAYEAAASIEPMTEPGARAALGAARLHLMRSDTPRARAALSNCLYRAHSLLPKAEPLFLLSQCAMADADAADARRLLLDALASPSNEFLLPHLRCSLAVANLSLGLTNEAREAFTGLAVAGVPPFVTAVSQFHLALDLLDRGRTNEARAKLAAVIATRTKRDDAAFLMVAAEGFPWADALFLCAQLDSAARQTAAARDSFETCLQLYPSSHVSEPAALGAALAAMTLGDLGSATQHFHHLLAAAQPAVRTSSLLQLGDIARTSSNYPAALGYYQTAFVLSSNTSAGAEALFRMGVAHYEQGGFVMAEKSFASAAAMATNAVQDDARYWAAWSLLEQGQPTEARARFEAYLAAFPAGLHAAEAELQQARLAYQLGDFKNAVQDYAVIVSNASDAACTEQAAYELGWVYIGLGEHAGAIAQFSRFVTDYPDSPLSTEVEYYLGETFFNQSDYQRARSSFQKVVERYPTGQFAAASAYWAGMAAYRLGDYSACTAVLSAHWQRVMASTEAPAALLLKGDCARATFAWTNALDAYRGAQACATASYLAVEAQFRIGACQLDLSNTTAAIAQFLSLTIDDHGMNRARAWLGLGDARRAAGDLRGALAEWLRVIYDYRDYPALCNQAIDRAGRLYETLGEPQSAQQVYRLRTDLGAATATNAPPRNGAAITTN